jgi:hypothetical protein
MKRKIVTLSAFVIAVAGAFAFKTPANTSRLFQTAYKITDCSTASVSNCSTIASSARCKAGGVNVENQFDNPGCSVDLYQH